MNRRPLFDDKAIIREAAETLYPQVADWLEVEHENSHKEELIEDLVSVIEDDWEHDSYKMAKALDNVCMWSVDSGLVDILDRVHSLISEIQRSKAQQWLKDNNIKPGHKVGDHVRYNRYERTWTDWKSGKITEIDEVNGQYIIEEDGVEYTHSLPPNFGGGSYKLKGSVINFEQVENDQPWYTPEIHKGE